MTAAVKRGLVGLLLIGTFSTGCGDAQDRYCEAVADHQQELGEILGDGGPDALLLALPTFEELRSQSPDDISPDWDTVVRAIEELRDALQDAGVDPATFDREDPPAGLRQAQQDRIDVAAAGLIAAATVRSLGAVQQQSRDVCRTPLSI